MLICILQDLTQRCGVLFHAVHNERLLKIQSMSHRLPVLKGFTTEITERRIALTPDGGMKSSLCLNALLSWDFLTERCSGSKFSWGLPLEHTPSQLASHLVYCNLTSPVSCLTPQVCMKSRGYFYPPRIITFS